jgi:hypothetical protein
LSTTRKNLVKVAHAIDAQSLLPAATPPLENEPPHRKLGRPPVSSVRCGRRSVDVTLSVTAGARELIDDNGEVRHHVAQLLNVARGDALPGAFCLTLYAYTALIVSSPIKKEFQRRKS